MTERHYTHSIVSYADLKVIRRTLTENPKVSHWAYILHDKDKDVVTGRPRDPHFHIVATFKTAQSFKAVTNMFVSDQNTFSERVKGEISDCFDYFTHEGLEDKYHYPKTDIVYSDKEYWEKRISEGADEVNNNDLFINDLLSDDFDELSFARKYGRDYIKNRHTYNEFRRSFVNDDLNPFIIEDNNLLRGSLEASRATVEQLEYELSSAKSILHEELEKQRFYISENTNLLNRNKELEAIVDRLDQQNTILMNMIKELTKNV